MDAICKKLRDDTSVTVSDIKNMLKDSNEYPSNEKFKFEFANFPFEYWQSDLASRGFDREKE